MAISLGLSQSSHSKGLDVSKVPTDGPNIQSVNFFAQFRSPGAKSCVRQKDDRHIFPQIFGPPVTLDLHSLARRSTVAKARATSDALEAAVEVLSQGTGLPIASTALTERVAESAEGSDAEWGLRTSSLRQDAFAANGSCAKVEKTEEEQEDVSGLYAYELKVATQAVQLACQLCRRVQEQIRRDEEKANLKSDQSPVTIADWGVQAVVSLVLVQAFPDQPISMVAEEDTDALKGHSAITQVTRIVTAVNECMAESDLVGLPLPPVPLGAIDVLKAIQRGTSDGGRKGRHWILDPVDGTLGFVRGDQYAIALAMMEDGKVVLGVLGCPNFPMRTEWLRYPHRYHRMAEKLFPPSPGQWHKGCVMKARRGGSGAWMEPLAGDHVGQGRAGRVDDGMAGKAKGKGEGGMATVTVSKRIRVSMIDDPTAATFCEPVEKANTSQEFSQGVARGIGLMNRPLRVYSMAKYAAIARGDAEIFMKFAKASYREKIWDHAAGIILVEEAGGMVTDAGGRPLDFSRGRYLEGLDRGIIVSSGTKLHNRVLGSVEESYSSSKL